MEENKNKYPGFIDGLKASNIATNRTSLEVSSEQIDNCISYIIKLDKLPEFATENMNGLQSAIKDTLNSNVSEGELIQKHIKFGDLFKSSLSYLKRADESKEFLKDIAINYLQIAKYTKDTRITNLAIEIAKELEE